jgi:hypothetical protein
LSSDCFRIALIHLATVRLDVNTGHLRPPKRGQNLRQVAALGKEGVRLRGSHEARAPSPASYPPEARQETGADSVSSIKHDARHTRARTSNEEQAIPADGSRSLRR